MATKTEFLDVRLTQGELKQLLNQNTKIYLPSYVSNPRVLEMIQDILNKEGEELTNNPNDSGGLTKWGVTEKTARSLGYEGQMKDMTLEKATLIAANEFYYKPNIHLLNKFGARLTAEAFDAAYLCGAGTVIKCIQRFLNAMNRRGKDWPDISVDGGLGPKTLDALSRATSLRGEGLVLKNLRGSLYTHFLELVEKREKDEEFFNGWVDKRIGL